MKIVIVGGVAGGASAAARARRLDENAEITVYERGEFVSFANCGLPYHVGKVIKRRESLILMTPDSFNTRTAVTIKNLHEVTKINKDQKTVTVKNLASGESFEDPYDKLILSPGSSPLRPPIPGTNDPDVMVLWTINDMDRIVSGINNGAESAVVIGGGFIGVEVAENLTHRGLKTSLVERAPHVLAQFDREMAQPLHDSLTENGVSLHLNDGVAKVRRTKVDNDKHFDKGFVIELTSGKTIEADIVVMAIGVRPNNELAKEAGLEIGESQGIKVNKSLQTSDPDIYAVGDAIEVTSLVSGKPVRIPLAGPANRQGRIAANNIFGGKEEYKGSLGTSICKVFDVAAGSTGFSETMLKRDSIPYKKLYINPVSHASYYPGAALLSVKVLFNDEGHILGAQITGNDGVDKRIDVLATAIRNKLTLADLEELELAYAPPFGSAKDVINFIGFVGQNMLKGDTDVTYPDTVPSDSLILDVRSPAEFSCGHALDAVNIPLNELRGRLSELSKDRHIAVMCRSGVRSWNAERILKANGFNVSNIAGGYLTWLLFNRDKGSVLTADSCCSDSTKKKSLNDSSSENEDVEVTGQSNEAADVIEELDACGLQCPGPIVQVMKKLETMKQGQKLKVLVSDKGFKKDIEAWCSSTGNTLVNVSTEGNEISALIQKGTAALPAVVQTAAPAPIKKTTIVLFSNDLDKSIAAFILATGFASLGHEVSIFFTFWGLNVLRKDNPPSVVKDFLSRMFGFMMPRGAKKLALSKMHMMGMGTAMMKHVMASKNVDSLPALIKQAQAMNVKFVACEMAMDVMGIQKEELLDGVDSAGVANFAALAEKSGTTLFI
jgi:NADPH-dependent 2,4-dienoyl-CoA reductase/sulfur reductase-like enzyme/peroxiredoxin family protein/TusA-related sulfurtransferase/rhodanese-related sulfurtransferase